jgi:hypothetical protein
MNPILDYSLIGAAISIPFVIWVLLDPSITPQSFRTKVIVFLFFNYAHFAASTVRLYTNPISHLGDGLVAADCYPHHNSLHRVPEGSWRPPLGPGHTWSP